MIPSGVSARHLFRRRAALLLLLISCSAAAPAAAAPALEKAVEIGRKGAIPPNEGVADLIRMHVK